MLNFMNYFYYLVDKSFWFFFSVFSVMSLVMGLVKWFYIFNVSLVVISFFVIFLIMI